MVSTGTDEAPLAAAGKGSNNSGKAATDKQAVSRKSPAGKKATRNKAGSRNKPAGGSNTEKPGRKAAGNGKQTRGKTRKKTAPAVSKTAAAAKPARTLEDDRDGVNGTAADTVTASEDSQSISWMAAQAVSALNAVKASQAIKAESLLARVEKPVPGRAAITELPEQTSEDLLEEQPGVDTAAAAAANPARPEATTASPASAGEIQTIDKETTVMQDKPGEQATQAESTAADTRTETAATAASASPEPGAVADTEAVVAAQAQQSGVPVRPIVATVFLILLAFTGYRYWQENRDSGVAAPSAASSYSEPLEEPGWEDIPQQSGIAVVGSATGERPAATAAAPGMAAGIEAQPGTSPGEVPASGAATQTLTPATTADYAATAPQPAADTAPALAGQAEEEAQETVDTATGETAQPAVAETAASEPRQPEAAAPVTPAAQPQPQPRYGGPGYSYYPQQPNWQQPYYQPQYPPQYPAR